MTAAAFTCPECRDTYHPHWLAPDGSGACRSCAASRDGHCYTDGHPDHDGPCSGPQEQAGEPCRYCGKPVAATGTPCPDCTVSLDGMALADIKALFAGDDSLTIGGLQSGVLTADSGATYLVGDAVGLAPDPAVPCDEPTATRNVLTGECRCVVCPRCRHHTGNAHQGHYWALCRVTGTTREFHLCCPDPAFGCSLERIARDPGAEGSPS